MSDGCLECGHPEGGHNASCSVSIRERNDEINRLTTALRVIKEGYGPDHGSKFCWKIACSALERVPQQEPTTTEKQDG